MAAAQGLSQVVGRGRNLGLKEYRKPLELEFVRQGLPDYAQGAAAAGRSRISVKEWRGDYRK